MTEIRQLIASTAFSDLDRHFAAFVEEQAGRGSHPAGARPFSGAAASAPPRSPGSSETLPLADVAAPEDGRTPGCEQPLVALAAALASYKRGQGHICLDLAALAGSMFPDLPADGSNPTQLPRLKDWTKILRTSPVVGSPGEFKPLVLDAHHRLYLHRYWEYEQTLASA